MATVKSLRIKRELELLSQDPPPGIAVWAKNDGNISELDASIFGPKDSPYENGIFKLEINIPDKYPFVPPLVRFITPIYHPNIDTEGRICLDLLKMPPNGNWKPCLNLSSLLVSIQSLMTDPNADDPLRLEVSQEFKNSRLLFDKQAKEWTLKHATMQKVNITPTNQVKIKTKHPPRPSTF